LFPAAAVAEKFAIASGFAKVSVPAGVAERDLDPALSEIKCLNRQSFAAFAIRVSIILLRYNLMTPGGDIWPGDIFTRFATGCLKSDRTLGSGCADRPRVPGPGRHRRRADLVRGRFGRSSPAEEKPLREDTLLESSPSQAPKSRQFANTAFQDPPGATASCNHPHHRPQQRNRWFADSPLEGDGFELQVPRQIGNALRRRR
jgi:hypothetical protein